MAKKTDDKVKTIDVQEIRMGRLTCHLLGTTPLIMHRFAFKAWQELLLPSQKLNMAAKAENLKHDPLNEFRESIYRNRDKNELTLVHFPSGAFSKAIAAAALDLPGANKSQILRLVSIASSQINVYGTPMLGMDMVRNSDQKQTPDVRTRAYFPEWACKIEVEYVATLIGERQIANLLGAAGVITGIGDYRPQKGGTHGKFKLVSHDDAQYLRVLRQNRGIQEAALKEPSFFDEATAELYEWFVEETKRREKNVPSLSGNGVAGKKKLKTPAGVIAVSEKLSTRKTL